MPRSGRKFFQNVIFRAERAVSPTRQNTFFEVFCKNSGQRSMSREIRNSAFLNLKIQERISGAVYSAIASGMVPYSGLILCWLLGLRFRV
jgi:hypothetical protein